LRPSILFLTKRPCQRPEISRHSSSGIALVLVYFILFREGPLYWPFKVYCQLASSDTVTGECLFHEALPFWT
jgi:hypothetical protein